MNDAETQIFLTACDHALTFTTAQIRMAVAYVTPVAQTLENGSENRGYLDSSLEHLHLLHGYLLDQLARLNAMSAEMGNKRDKATSATADDADNTEFKVH
ncbi:hypothetical protein QZN01_25475 [Burkholderia cenocepacia]|uniref:hypothetical protein n=1 Tax=Burkholderia cenocepacia TaxID=95486 RepID=UPI000A0335AE|nr:hypothetical protein [Burkholderia cenocepacia]MDC6082112.1 hypothetical protein [Burkholderia cenocepacia]MDN7826018.1 hypothetical protein [Burkholderia cenocepacia]HEM9002624.1 hypothetical protein [Burkholderia cenocepacia]